MGSATVIVSKRKEGKGDEKKQTEKDIPKAGGEFVKIANKKKEKVKKAEK